MAPIYNLWMMRPTEAYFRLSEQERAALAAKSADALKQVGGKTILMCTPMWSAEQWALFGVEEFPSIEAVQKHTELLYGSEGSRYAESVSMLGTQWPPA